MTILGTPEQQLIFLRWHWDTAYDISVTDDGWRAVRKDDGAALVTETAEELRDAMLADYTARPVPRPPYAQEGTE